MLLTSGTNSPHNVGQMLGSVSSLFFLGSTGDKDATHIPFESCKWPANKSRMNCSWEHTLGSAKVKEDHLVFSFRILAKWGETVSCSAHTKCESHHVSAEEICRIIRQLNQENHKVISKFYPVWEGS